MINIQADLYIKNTFLCMSMTKDKILNADYTKYNIQKDEDRNE